MHVERNTEARLCNHCCSGKAITITHPESVLLALRIQHASRMRHIIIRALPGSTLFSHII